MEALIAVLGAVIGAVVAWVLNRRQHNLEVENLKLDIDRKDLDEEKVRLEVEKLKYELEKKELIYEKEKLELKNLRAEIESRDLANNKSQKEIEKLEIELEMLKKHLLQLNKDEFWQKLERNAMGLQMETDQPRWMSLKNAYARIDSFEMFDDEDQLRRESDDGNDYIDDTDSERSDTSDLLVEILQRALDPFFTEIKRAENAEARVEAINKFKNYIEGSGIKESHNMPDAVFNQYIDDSIQQMKFLRPDSWLMERLMNLSELPQDLQQEVFSYSLDRLISSMTANEDG